MSIHRQAVTDALISDSIMQIIKTRNIQLKSWAGTYNLDTSANINQVKIWNSDQAEICYMPNPSQGQVDIKYVVSTAAHVCINILDTRGAIVSNLVSSEQPMGKHNITWTANSNPSGVYYIQYILNNKIQHTGKIILQ
jgi:hypothetical protein